MSNNLLELTRLGQSTWLDFISRDLLKRGDLEKLIKENNIRGITSNPSIFNQAIAHSSNYDAQIRNLLKNNITNPKTIYEKLAIADIKDAADLLHEIYISTDKKDGYACLEVSPHLAFDTSGTILEAKRLWQEVNKPNVMIKVPGTLPGMPAITELIKSGININVTLLFDTNYYQKAAEAYYLGLQERESLGFPTDHVHSVASFFISRIDTKVDNLLKKIIDSPADKKQKIIAESLLGKVAIANAHAAYEIFLQQRPLLCSGSEGNPQRLLWASTGTKNKSYSDVLYIDSLIADQTVNTMPLDTLRAFKDHGQARSWVEQNMPEPAQILSLLASLNIDLSSVCDELLSEGVDIFTASFDSLLDAVERKTSLS